MQKYQLASDAISSRRFVTGICYAREHGGKIASYFIVGEPQNPQTVRSEHQIALGIVLSLS